MTPEELVRLCNESPVLTLRLPPPLSEGYTRQMFGNRGPRGEIVCGVPDSHQVVRFKSANVLRWIKHNWGEVKEAKP